MASDEIDSLFQVLPAEFVKARNALAKSLRGAGQRQAAERVAKLTRPTASVWATNQVARRDSKLVQRLAEATEHLQGGVAHGKDRYAAAINAHRELLNELRARIESVLRAGGLRDAPATVAAAMQNFRSGLTDESVRAVIEGGRLQEDVGVDAGGGVFGLSAPASDSESESEPSAPAHRAAAKPAPERRADHDGHARERERERREQERAAAKARAEGERRVHAAKKVADAAQAARVKHESAVAAARAALERAERARDAAQTSEEEAKRALAAEQTALDKLR